MLNSFRGLGVALVGVVSWSSIACGAELPDYPDDVNSGVPVNYTESKVAPYTLPDPLTGADGSDVTDSKAWESRRAEVRKLVEENQYGRAPGRPEAMRFEIAEDSTPAFDGKAIRKQVAIHLGEGDESQTLDLLVYLPANAKGPVPVLLNLSFMANNLTVDDPGVKVGRSWDREKNERVPAVGGRRFGSLPVLSFIERGFGLATFNYTDVDPDAPGAIAHGVRRAYLKDGETAPAADEWGTIAAWAWGISRVLDYFETDDEVDAKRVAITGCSRLGKTVMWAGANDPRVALVIASCSGEGGAALSRRNYGEAIGHLVAPNRYPYQFAAIYQKYAANPDESPVDANMLIALVAPRPLLLQTGDTDKWSDPKGEFLAAVAATPVYELLGEKGIDRETLPAPGELVGDTLAFYMHDGGHGIVPSDWDVYLDFMSKHLSAQEKNGAGGATE